MPRYRYFLRDYWVEDVPMPPARLYTPVLETEAVGGETVNYYNTPPHTPPYPPVPRNKHVRTTFVHASGIWLTRILPGAGLHATTISSFTHDHAGNVLRRHSTWLSACDQHQRAAANLGMAIESKYPQACDALTEDPQAHTWVTRERQSIPISQMPENHLHNAISWVRRKTDELFVEGGTNQFAIQRNVHMHMMLLREVTQRSELGLRRFVEEVADYMDVPLCAAADRFARSLNARTTDGFIHVPYMPLYRTDDMRAESQMAQHIAESSVLINPGEET